MEKIFIIEKKEQGKTTHLTYCQEGEEYEWYDLFYQELACRWYEFKAHLIHNSARFKTLEEATAVANNIADHLLSLGNLHADLDIINVTIERVKNSSGEFELEIIKKNKVVKSIAKDLEDIPLGKFGEEIYNKITEVYDMDIKDFDLQFKSRRVLLASYLEKYLNKSKFLVIKFNKGFEPNLDKKSHVLTDMRRMRVFNHHDEAWNYCRSIPSLETSHNFAEIYMINEQDCILLYSSESWYSYQDNERKEYKRYLEYIHELFVKQNNRKEAREIKNSIKTTEPVNEKSTMTFDDATQPFVSMDVSDCATMKQDEIIAKLIEQAELENCEPCDFNYASKSNIYLRGEYEILPDTNEKIHIKDIFIMFVKEKELSEKEENIKEIKELLSNKNNTMNIILFAENTWGMRWVIDKVENNIDNVVTQIKEWEEEQEKRLSKYAYSPDRAYINFIFQVFSKDREILHSSHLIKKDVLEIFDYLKSAERA